MIDVSRNRQEFLQSHLAELASADFEAWARESFEIAIKIVYRNDGRTGIPRLGNLDCAMVAAAPPQRFLWATLLVLAGLPIDGFFWRYTAWRIF
jgi:hypothetical protein